MENTALSINRSSLREQVYEILRDQLDGGELEPGSVIRQDDIAAKLGVSRTPMREALRILASEQLVELLPNRGAIVSKPSPGEVRDLLSVLGALGLLIRK